MYIHTVSKIMLVLRRLILKMYALALPHMYKFVSDNANFYM